MEAHPPLGTTFLQHHGLGFGRFETHPWPGSELFQALEDPLGTDNVVTVKSYIKALTWGCRISDWACTHSFSCLDHHTHRRGAENN